MATKCEQSSKACYVVNGTNIPDVNFDVGESYAGLMPITSGPNDEQQFYFWYFVSPNELASNEILIWLNGGPGASSLEGLLQENGPFLWQFGTFRPVPNPWTWVNLTNVIWVEQPIGTGFTQGNVSAITEEDVAQQFLGFWRNFIDVFDMHNREVYIAGESYAGMFIPYIADAMFTANDTSYFNLQATMMFDPLINNNNVMRQIPTVAYVEEWNSLMGMNTSFVSDLKRRGDECGYTQFLEDNLKYPPSGKLPISPFGPDDPPVECDVWDAVIDAATLVNPCFDIYQIATTCPLLWDVMGFPGTLQYTPQGADVYFDRPDVKRAINAPQVPWAEASPKPTYNTSNGLSVEYNTGIFTSQTVLPSVIDRSKRTVIGHSNLGYILLRAGTLLTIQNMTWGGIQGFQTPVEEDFFVPYHDDPFLATMAGAGIMGKTRTERGLTYFGIDGAGHMVPQYAPSAAYRGLEFLLGRIPSLSSTQPFTSSTSKLEVKRRTQVNG
ncbi:Alpha/Beta hydrolase protein [Hypomontagnella monticulosa]|nr:Alpha/Beta hydrolase protein [Hypomontagnella monticulosa]